MAAVSAGRPRSLFGKASAAAASRKRAKPGRMAAVLAVAREHVVTFAALAAVDLGAFDAARPAGWIVTGVSLLALDFAVRG